ncbi:abortive infection family protein [Cardiobacterium hominis]|uniref:MuF-C-terminal domain-containing protein n=1 Tax=Cardiobacterium hominis TaxID=2718 RepID=UPI0006608C15|nr:abortive infection family protein [Cardiobacterium hominis]
MDLLQDALARRDNLLQAFNRNPDQAAELRRIAQETNTPAGFVDDHTRALHRLNGLEKTLSNLSILPAAIRRSLNFATLAQDDMETLASLEKVSQARQRRRAQQEQEYQAQYRAMQPNILEENRDNFFAGLRDFVNKRDLKTAVERQAELGQFNRGEGFEGLHYQIGELEKAAAEEGGMDKLSPEAQQQYRELIARREGMAAEIMGERDQAIADYLEDAASIAAVPRSDKTQAQMEALGQMQGADKFFYVLENPRTLAQTVSGSAGYMAPALAATVGTTATAGPGAGMVVAGAGSYIGERSATIEERLNELAQARGGLSGLRLEEVRDLIAGADVDEIISAANRRGAAVGLFDALSMGVAGKIAGWGSRTGRHVSAAGAGIAASMGMGAAGEAAGQIADRGEVHDWGDVGLEAVAEIATGGTELASAYAHLGIEGMKKEQAADLDNLTAMTDAARASKLNQRAPDVFRGWTEQIEENADIQHYYVDGNALHQSGLVAALEKALPDRVGEIRQALATGGTVQIPAADILTKIAPDKGLEDAITPHLRTADGLSLHELETSGQAELEGAIMENAARAEQAAAQQTETDAIRDDFAAQITATGRMTRDAALQNAALPAAFYQTVAQRLGISVSEAYEKYKLKVVGEPLAGLQNAGTAGNTQDIDAEVVSEAARLGGMDIAGYQRAIAHDAVAIQQENGKNQSVFLTDADRTTISDTITNPNVRVYGLKTPDGQRTLVSVKALPEGGVAVVEEVLAGGKTLAAKSLRRYTGDTEQTLKALREESWQRGNRESIFDVPVTPRQASSQNSYQQLDETADSAFAQAIERVVSGENITGFVPMGTTPEALQLAGLPDVRVSIRGNVIKKVMNEWMGGGHGHNLNPDTLKRLPMELNRPVAVARSAQDSSNRDAYIVLTELTETDIYDGKEKPVIAALMVNVTNGGLEVVNITSVYGRSKAQIQRSLNTDLLYWDKEKGKQFVNAFRLQLPSHLRTDAALAKANIKTNEDLTQGADPQQEFAATAKQYGGEAAYEQAKAAGRTELNYRQWVQVRTPSFKAWFGDWENDPENASKVVNPRTGEPLVVYHGTNAQFDTFDTPLNMPRIFLTRSRAFAQKYGRDSMPLFVNARNTLNVDYAGRGAFDEIEVNGEPLYDIEELADHAWENGYDGVLADNVVDSGTRDAKQSINDEVIVTDPAQIKSATGNSGAFDPADANIYHQNAPTPRGAFDPTTNTIALLEKADLSTFIHELGHFYFETLTRIANDLRARDNAAGGGTLTEGEIQILKDVDTLIGKAGYTLDDWNQMTLEERRYHHETVARQFEAYLMEGKAPSVELQGIFSRLRSWLFAVYKKLTALNVKLDDDVRQVFDRMLASDEAIQIAEQNRSMMPLFATPEAAGMTAEQFADYQRQFQGASDAALDEMSLRMLADAKAIARLKHKALKAKDKEAKILRGETEIEARNAIMAQPVYRVWQMLSGKMNADTTIASNQRPWTDAVAPEHDDLFTAIAKLGGINRSDIESTWGFDPADKISPVKPGFFVLRREGGQSLDGMRQALVQYGYLTESDSLNDFYELFEAQRRGDTQYSNRRQPDPGVGKTGEHAHLHDLPAFRLDHASLAEMGYGDEQIATLGRKVKKKGGIHPDLLAELVMDADGNPVYDSGDALVQALLAAPEPKTAVRELTDRIMLERHGELATPEAISEAADMAVHNDIRLRVLATEYNALAQASGGARLVQSAARQLAAQAIGQKRIRDLSPAQYTRMETRAAKAALAAMKKGDIATAAAEKRNQVLQASLARAAHEAKVEVKKLAMMLRRMNRLNPKKVAIEEREQIEALLERFDLRDQSGRAIDRKQSLAEWVQAQREQGIEPDIAPEMLDELKRQPWQTLTVDELRGLVDTVRQIEHRGKVKNQLLLEQKQQDLNVAKEEISETVKASGNGKIVDNSTPATWLGQRMAALRRFGWMHTKASTVFYILDGGQRNGPMWRYFGKLANARANFEAAERARLSEALMKISTPLFKRKGLYKRSIRSDIPDRNGQPRVFTPMQVFTVALNMGNAGNLQRLLDGNHWTREQVERLTANLTGDEWRAVQNIWNLFESMKEQVAAKERRVNGIEPQWVEAVPLTVTSIDGETLHLRGGYYPVKYDAGQSQQAEQFQDAEAGQIMTNAAFTSATTRRSYTKARAAAVKDRPLLLDISVMYDGLNEIVHDLAWHEFLIDANRLIRSHRVDSAIRDYHGAEYVRLIKDWLQDIAAGDKIPSTYGARMVAAIRQNVSFAGLAFNVVSALKQLSGLPNSIVRVGAPDILAATLQYMRRGRAMTREAVAASAVMENRARTRFRELNEVRNSLRRQGRVKQQLYRWGYAPLLFFQQQVDVITWHGEYHKQLAAGMSEADAVALADQAVLDAQGGGELKDLSAIERDPVGKIFTVFYSYMNTVLNLGITTVKGRASIGRKAAALLTLFTVPAIIDTLLGTMLTLGDDDDDDETLGQKLVEGQIGYLMGLTVLTREASGAAKALFGVDKGSYKGPTAFRFFDDLHKAAKQIGQGEMDEAMLTSIINLSGDFGLPSAQINRSIKGIKALEEGKTDNPLAVAVGYKEKK